MTGIKKIASEGLVLCLLLPVFANAYELATHARLTQAAYTRSVLADPQLMLDLGIDASSSSVFGEKYFDVSGTQASERTQNDFEKGKMPDDGADFLKVNGWLMRGAIREDDVPSWAGNNPQDDPYGSIFRVFNHFYDPIFNRPLTVLAGLGETAPNWGIGTSDALTATPAPNSGRRNHFSVFDAREAMYRALTGRDMSGHPLAVTEAERDKYWATTFRALGDVVHLVQDMAQPQHRHSVSLPCSQLSRGPRHA